MAQEMVYLVTLSHAERVPQVTGKQDFANKVAEAFFLCFGDVVSCWCSSKELHSDGGYHYHLALKLRRSYRFAKVAALLRADGICANFAAPPEGSNYYHALAYVTKSDTDAAKSSGHPVSVPRPRTEAASRSRRPSVRRFLADGTEALDPIAVEEKPLKMSKVDLAEIVLSEGIKTYDQLLLEGVALYFSLLMKVHKNIVLERNFMLLSAAEKRRRVSDAQLFNFIIMRGRKSVEETVMLTNAMKTSVEDAAMSQRTRLQVLVDVMQKPCECTEKGL
jgi:hypothetical protein